MVIVSRDFLKRKRNYSHENFISRVTAVTSEGSNRSDVLIKLPPPSRTCTVNVLKLTMLAEKYGPKSAGKSAKSSCPLLPRVTRTI